ncbi:MAG: hypothetical protein QOJ93_3286, partial [Actinomycetota bacterium]|nr:hypothetical protein [Actinomycetota bacterium]
AVRDRHPLTWGHNQCPRNLRLERNSEPRGLQRREASTAEAARRQERRFSTPLIDSFLFSRWYRSTYYRMDETCQSVRPYLQRASKRRALKGRSGGGGACQGDELADHLAIIISRVVESCRSQHLSLTLSRIRGESVPLAVENEPCDLCGRNDRWVRVYRDPFGEARRPGRWPNLMMHSDCFLTYIKQRKSAPRRQARPNVHI